jgi:hypothetical protein
MSETQDSGQRSLGEDQQGLIPRQAAGQNGGGNLRLRPLAVYRQARRWDRSQASAEYDKLAEGLAPEERGDYPMTEEKLRRYEQWPDGAGLLPSAPTIAVLASLYDADVRNLIDREAYGALPGPQVKSQPPGSTSNSLAQSMVGQATAAIAVAAALIYVSGGIALGFKLWFMRIPWTPVLGQLPRDFLLATAVGQVVLPCVIAGAALGALAESCKGLGASRGRNKVRTRAVFWGLNIIISLAAGAVLGLAPLGTLLFTAQAIHQGVLLAKTDIYLACAAFSATTMFCWISFLRWLYNPDRHLAASVSSRGTRSVLRTALAMGSAAVALVPSVASVSGAYLLPQVVLCGSTFASQPSPEGPATPGFMQGSLIGNNSQWIYIAQFEFNTKHVAGSRSITAVPASSVQIEAIGQHTGCGDLKSS